MKRLAIKVDEYEKDGKTKGKYIDLGIVLETSNGQEYILMNPDVNLAGALIRQRVLNAANKKKTKGDMLMVSVFDDSNGSGGNSNSKSNSNSGGGNVDDFDDDIPF